MCMWKNIQWSYCKCLCFPHDVWTRCYYKEQSRYHWYVHLWYETKRRPYIWDILLMILMLQAVNKTELPDLLEVQLLINKSIWLFSWDHYNNKDNDNEECCFIEAHYCMTKLLIVTIALNWHSQSYIRLLRSFYSGITLIYKTSIVPEQKRRNYLV